jgi:hypothetical protein
VPSKDSNQYEYYIKWKKKSFLQCTWVVESRLKQIASQKLRNFIKYIEQNEISEDPKELVKEEWCIIDRVIAQQANQDLFLVKWKGLPYEQCTWEPKLSIPTHKIQQFHLFNTPKPTNSSSNTNTTSEQCTFEKVTTQPAFLKGG